MRRQPLILFTLGYEKRSIDEFVGLILEAGIDDVVDVRDVPWSHKPGFSKGPLQAALAAAGIGYVHAGFAGNPKWLRSVAESHGEMLQLYEWYLAEFGEVELQFEELLAGLHAKGTRACVMCFERKPEECHRTILAERWRVLRRGRRVEHVGTV